MDTRFYNSLQIYRGIAAMMVVFHHIWNNLRYYYHLKIAWVDAVASAGRYGVDFFFVLSGFIICYSNFFGTKGDIQSYGKNRFLRIFIPYWPIGLTMLGLYFLLPGVSGNERDVNIVKSIFLLPLNGPTALSVAWTLVYEIFFYTVFAVWFFSRRAFAWVFAIWLLLILSRYIFNFTPETLFAKFVTSYYNLEFIFGVACALFLRSSQFSKKYAAALMAVVLVLLLIVVHGGGFLRHSVLGLLFASIILLSVKSRLDNVAKRNIFMIIGNASYSLYLIHNPVISFTLRLAKSLPALNYVVTMIAVFFSCILVGVLYSKVFEEFALKRIKKLLAFGKLQT